MWAVMLIPWSGDLVEASIRIHKTKASGAEIFHCRRNYRGKDYRGHHSWEEKSSPQSGGVRGPFDFILGGGFQPNQQQTKVEEPDENKSETELAREQVRQQLRAGLLEDQFIEIEIAETQKQSAGFRQRRYEHCYR